jgi:hypothetical protein
MLFLLLVVAVDVEIWIKKATAEPLPPCSCTIKQVRVLSRVPTLNGRINRQKAMKSEAGRLEYPRPLKPPRRREIILDSAAEGEQICQICPLLMHSAWEATCAQKYCGIESR